MNSKMSERMSVVASAAGTATTGSPLVTGYVTPEFWERAYGLIILDEPDNAEAVTIEMLEATDSSGTSATVISGKTKTLVAHATNNDSTVHQIDLDCKVLADATSGEKKFIALRVSTDGATGTVCTMALIAGDVAHTPASDLNGSDVTAAI